jgi:alpha-beta hydrolase superfamily lysophospholipase
MAIMLSLREDLPPQVKGMILMAPMVMIHPSMMPPKAVVNMLRKINKSHPKAKIGRHYPLCIFPLRSRQSTNML